MASAFTPFHRAGHGSPMVCLHGFTDTWRSWELVLRAVAARHDVLATPPPGHAGGPPLDGHVDEDTIADLLEAAMDGACFETAHLVGNSLGGYLALRLAARGRARTVVALAPAGGWAPGDESYKDTLRYFAVMNQLVAKAGPHAEQIAATVGGRRRATEKLATSFDHIPAELVAHMIAGAAGGRGGAGPLQGADPHA